MLFGRSSEKSPPEPPAGGGGDDDDDEPCGCGLMPGYVNVLAGSGA
jgi:hypothetical protein